MSGLLVGRYRPRVGEIAGKTADWLATEDCSPISFGELAGGLAKVVAWGEGFGVHNPIPIQILSSVKAMVNNRYILTDNYTNMHKRF